MSSSKVFTGPKGGKYVLVGGKKRYLPKNTSENSKSSNKSKSESAKSKSPKGWGKSKPKKGAEREKLAKSCGTKCFLLPEELKYPVCPRCGANSNECTCTPPCKGINAALNRSRMVVGKLKKRGGKGVEKHKRVLEKAKELKRKYNC